MASKEAGRSNTYIGVTGEAQSSNAYQSVTEDGLVSKKTLREGKGGIPSLHSTCLVHYVGHIDEGDTVFVDTRSEGDPVKIVAGRDSVLRNAGINLAVAKMKIGELASVRVSPEYGYGTKGSFSFPSVPPNSRLTYELELLQFDAVPEGKASRDMLFEERLEAAERRRIDGNAFFKAGSTSDALGKYAMGLSYLDQDFMFQLQGPHEEKANAIRIPILLNMAACYLQMADYKGAIETATQVLSSSGKNAKALFRRGKAYRLSGQMNAALTDLGAARELLPGDKAVLQEIQATKRGMAEDRKASDNLFRGRLPAAKPSVKKSVVLWERLWLKIQQLFLPLWSKLSRHQHSD